MRIYNSFKNVISVLILQAIVMILGFASRKIFLINLDEGYLGLNGLFSSIITLLSMAELGIANSIVYSLYKPLEEDNKILVAKLMNFFKTSYRAIASIIFTLGILLYPFIPNIIGNSSFDAKFLSIVYFLFLFSSVSTYFFAYKRNIVYADQKNYKVMHIDICFKFISFVLTTIFLFIFQDYIVYLTSIMIIGFANNYYVSSYVDKLYPFLKSNKLKLEKHEIKIVLTNTKNIFIHRIAGTVISSTDNLIISKFLGLVQVGLYSNYSLIIASFQGIISRLLEACQPSIGNLLTVEKREKIEEALKNMTFLSFLLTSSATVSILCLANDFIMLWLGEKFLLGIPFVAICGINFFTANIKNPLYQFVNVSGLFREDRNNAIIGAVLNIALSVALVKLWGILGVILGALLASLVTLVLKTNFFYKKYLYKSSTSFLLRIIVFFAVVFCEMVLCYYLCGFIYVSNLLLVFALKCVVCILCPSMINILLFYNTKEFKYLTSLCITIGANYLKLKSA